MRGLRQTFVVVLPLLVLAFASCTDTKTVFVDRPFFDDPPAEAAAFLGYGTEDARIASFTVCGNCHIGSQGEWESTAHSHAWATLQASGHAQEFCEGCHTINERGNAAEGAVAWEATADARYEDVQCESCHGGGRTTSRTPKRPSRWPRSRSART